MDINYGKLVGWGVVCGIIAIVIWVLLTTVLGHTPIYPWTAIFVFCIIGFINGAGYSDIEEYEWLGSLFIAVLFGIVITYLGDLVAQPSELALLLDAIIINLFIGFVIGAICSAILIGIRQTLWGE